MPAAYDRRMRTKDVATVFNISPAWARRVKQRRRETGETTHRPMGPPVVMKVDRSCLPEVVLERPGATLVELRERPGIQCGLSTIFTALRELGLSSKTRRFTLRNRIDLVWSKGGIAGVRGPRTSMRVV